MSTRVIEIDISNYVDDLDEVDWDALRAARWAMEDARRCLNRPERSSAEAILHIESALARVERVLRSNHELDWPRQ